MKNKRFLKIMSHRVSRKTKIRKKSTWQSSPKVFSSSNQKKMKISQAVSKIYERGPKEKCMTLIKRIYSRDSLSATHFRKVAMWELRKDLLAASLAKEYLNVR